MLFALLFSTTLLASSALATCPPPAPDPGVDVPAFYGYPKHKAFECGKTDVFFTGLPPNHPLVISQGYSPDMVAGALAMDKAYILKSGYNLKTILQGPEEPIGNIGKNILFKPRGVYYDIAGVGFGERGAPFVNTTAQFENIISVYRQLLPRSPFAFNISPNSTILALKRVGPIQGDCSSTPGKDYGTYIYCSSTVCTVPYSPQLGTTYP